MPARFRGHLSPALVISLIALFVALGGVSYGVATGSIDGREERNSSLNGRDVRNSSLTTNDVRNGSLLARDFRAGQLPRGATGPQGPRGFNGVNGQNGFGRLSYWSGETTIAANTTGVDTFADCPAGTYPTGGDAYFVTADEDQTPVYNVPILEQGYFAVAGTPAGWYLVPGLNQNAFPVVAVVEAICANATTVDGGTTTQSAARNRSKRR